MGWGGVGTLDQPREVRQSSKAGVGWRTTGPLVLLVGGEWTWQSKSNWSDVAGHRCVPEPWMLESGKHFRPWAFFYTCCVCWCMWLPLE